MFMSIGILYSGVNVTFVRGRFTGAKALFLKGTSTRRRHGRGILASSAQRAVPILLAAEKENCHEEQKRIYFA